MNKYYLSFVVLFLSFGVLEARAKLEFDRKTIYLKSDAGVEALHGTVKFSNAGNRPIKIVEIISTCGCTAATLSKNTYDPNESGELRITFRVGGTLGHDLKTIELVTDEAEGNRYTIGVDVDIAELFSITPRVLSWHPEEGHVSKTVVVTFTPGKNTKIVDATIASDSFKTEMQPTADSNKSVIVVTPLKSDGDLRGELLIDLQQGEENHIQRKVFLRILPSAATIDPLRAAPAPKKK